MDGLELVRGLMARGYPAHQAAALAGHMLQESGGNPSALNKGEGANGLLQWRLDRWDNLKDYANASGKSPNDPEVQLDFIRREMEGPERKAGSAFLSSPDVESASAALKSYIRFGDDSAGTRLSNARGLLADIGSAPVGKLASASPVTTPGPVGELATDKPQTTADILSKLGTQLGGGQTQGQPQQQPVAPEYLQLQQIQLGRNPMTAQSSQIAQAIAKMYGIG